MIFSVKSMLKAHLSPQILHGLRYVRKKITPFFYWGWRFKCPICGGHFRKMLPAGVIPRQHAVCPRCGSFERHRLIWMYVTEKTTLCISPYKLLYCAPELCLQQKFQAMPALEYVSTDLYDPMVMVKMDITNIAFGDNRFDAILCCHVLEHILDDRAALKELFRVLKPGAWAILQVPISGETTFEDATITHPEERLKCFGQKDHVRIYGKDYKERLEHAGFSVKVVPYLRNMIPRRIHYYRLTPDNDTQEDIYFCIKPSVA